MVQIADLYILFMYIESIESNKNLFLIPFVQSELSELNIHQPNSLSPSMWCAHDTMIWMIHIIHVCIHGKANGILSDSFLPIFFYFCKLQKNILKNFLNDAMTKKLTHVRRWGAFRDSSERFDAKPKFILSRKIDVKRENSTNSKKILNWISKKQMKIVQLNK